MTSRLSDSQRGFGVIGFLILLPFLISVLSLIAGSVLLLNADARLKHDCRTSVLNSQREVASKLSELISLNLPAKALRVERTLAENELRLATLAANPPAVTIAKAHLLSVQLRQNALMIRQKALVVLARSKSMAAPAKAKAAVLGGLTKVSQENGVRMPGLRSSVRAGIFDVETEPKGDVTPDYKPSPQFTARQTVDLNVDLELGPLLPEWLRNLLPTKGLKLNTHCQGTIERQENEWIETLNAVR